MKDNIRFFKDADDCENFFKEYVKEYNEELTYKTIIFGNANISYKLILDIGNYLGFDNIGINQQVNDIESAIFIKVKGFANIKNNSRRFWFPNPDEMYIQDGIMRLWWD